MVAPMTSGPPKVFSTPPSSKQKQSPSEAGFSSPLDKFANLAEQVDWLTQCQSPAELFSFFSKDDDDGNYQDGDEQDEQMQKVCPYPLSSSCEYCGEKSTKDCDPSICKRPGSFFTKQRPPFIEKDEWAAKLGKEDSKITEERQKLERQQQQDEEKVWVKNMTNLFGTSSTIINNQNT